MMEATHMERMKRAKHSERMARALALLMLICLAPQARPAWANDQPPASDLRGDWQFGGKGAEAVQDHSTYRHSGTSHGPLRRVMGRHGAALQFNGRDTWVEIPFAPWLALRDKDAAEAVVDGEAEFIVAQEGAGLVIEVWLRPDTLEGRQAILGRYEEKDDQRSFRLFMEDGHLVFDHSYDGTARGTLGGGLISEQRLAAGQWNQVIVSYDGHFISFTINGRRDGAFMYSQGIHPTASPIQVGRHFDGAEGREYFRGAIDSIRISMPEFPAMAPRIPWEEEPAAAGSLNNMVRQLLDEASPSGDEYVFANPMNGWVFFAATGAKSAGERVRLDIEGLAGEVILEEDNRWEAMRRMPAGSYRMRLSREGDWQPDRLIVRRVPELIYVRYGYGPFDWDFLSQHVLHSVNINVSGPPPGEYKPLIAQWTGSGRQWIIERASGYWSGLKGWEGSYDRWGRWFQPPYAGTIADEFGSRYDYQAFLTWADIVRRLGREAPGSRFFAYVFDFERYPSNHPFINAVLENDGLVVWERYLSEQPNEEAARTAIRQSFVEPMRRIGTVFPGIQRQTVMCPSIWTGRRPLSNEHHPDVDYKVFLDMQFQVMATHPVFRDLAGIGPWTSGYADREIVRWLGALFRHYGIEGRTDLLSEQYGYSYRLDHLENAGFERGEQGLSLQPAEPGTIGIGHIQEVPEVVAKASAIEVAPRGERYLWMQRRAHAPNRVRQQIRNLTPGEYYSIKMYTSDLGDVKTAIEHPHAVSINVAGGEIVDDESERVVVEGRRRHASGSVYFSHFFIVFRATDTTAELEITDWADEASPGGPIGQKLYFDFLQVQPCYMGGRESQPASPSGRALLGTRTPGR